MKYFEFYNIEPAFEIDTVALRKAYLQKQREYHPDYFAENTSELEIAENTTSLNNTAFNTLSVFENRVEYILREMGFIKEGEKNILPDYFLLEMMDLNDEIQEAALNKSLRTEVEKKLNSKIEKNDGAMKELARTFSDLMSVEDPDFLKMKEFLQVKRYLTRLKKNLEGVDEF